METSPLKPCALCQEPCSHLGARGRNVVCRNCEKLATDSQGNGIEFGWPSGQVAQGFSDTELPIFAAGTPHAGDLCEEVNTNGFCFIGQTKVHLYEGVAGWFGLVLKTEE